MSGAKETHLTDLRRVLTSFWGEQLRIEPEGRGLVLAMPLMDASGWQVVLHLHPLTATRWMLSDGGATLGMIEGSGRSSESGRIRESVEEQCRFYGIQRNGLLLQQTVAFPFDPVEIQVFAEGLVALTHLCPRRQAAAATNTLSRMEDRISRYFYSKQVTPQRRHKLAGQIEPEIVVEFFWEGARSLALQPVGRQRHLRGYMEQWGWRWTDLGRAHPDLIKAMIFDPYTQEWDSSSMRIGEKVCDIFVPYDEAEAALDAAIAA